MHLFSQLRKVEKKYADELIVVGVHSAKFMAEQAQENIRHAILRYEIEHPVVNDRDFQLWQEYAVRAWPTLMFIDPQGKVIGRAEGEMRAETMDPLLGEMIQQFDRDGVINRAKIRFALERDKETDRPLSFPGKVLADHMSRRLFIADSNHNRIVVADLSGVVQDSIGSGEQGLRDGAFDQAQFNHPQGLAVDGEWLYVADTENHAIRRVDLAHKRVETIAGTGAQAQGFPTGGLATATALNSPWDLALAPSAGPASGQAVVYIAMAGFHQLWALDLRQSTVRLYAGNGREDIIDGPLSSASLAQPSGITTDGKLLYFADSETSSVRTADLDPDGRVRTLVGLGLFEFGDLDGVGDSVRLQHPLGVCFHEGAVYLADTYNC